MLLFDIVNHFKHPPLEPLDATFYSFCQKRDSDAMWIRFDTCSYFKSWKGPSQDSLNLFTNHVDDETW